LVKDIIEAGKNKENRIAVWNSSTIPKQRRKNYLGTKGGDWKRVEKKKKDKSRELKQGTIRCREKGTNFWGGGKKGRNAEKGNNAG